MLKNNFAEFKKLKSYKLLRLFYIVLCFWAIWINFRWIFVESRRNVGVTASMMDVATFKIAVVTYPLLFVLLLVVLRILTINYLYTKNINKVKIAIVILLISGFALGFTHAYLSDRLDSFFNAYYDQEERIYQECRQKYQSDAAPDSTSTDWGLAGDPCVSFGKPVIYFYPEKTLDIFVKVKPVGGLTLTDPVYPEGGWEITAEPDGDLFNLTDGKHYPYLFWEGNGYSERLRPTAGFLLKNDEVHDKMSNLLMKKGLSEKEINDFMEFWEPRLKVKPYVWVTFVDQDVFDKLAPLEVTPKPDTVIRVFFDYRLSDTPILTPEQVITTPVRSGFTVVEWGGALHH